MLNVLQQIFITILFFRIFSIHFYCMVSRAYLQNNLKDKTNRSQQQWYPFHFVERSIYPPKCMQLEAHVNMIIKTNKTKCWHWIKCISAAALCVWWSDKYIYLLCRPFESYLKVISGRHTRMVVILKFHLWEQALINHSTPS